MRSRWWLALWILGIIFPAGLITEISPAYRRVFNAVFAPEWMHWLSHALLYAVLVLLLFAVFRQKLTWRSVLTALAVALAVGLLQEGLQWLSNTTAGKWNSLLDLGMDMIGSVAGLAVAGFFGRKARIRLL